MKRHGLFFIVLFLCMRFSSQAAEILPPYLEGAQVEAIRLRIQAFERRIAEHRQRIQDILVRKKLAEEQKIESTYQRVVDALQEKERKRRAALIQRMEQFLQRHPGSQLAAETILRLGELYFERANDDFIVRMSAYERDLERFSKGEIKQEPELPLIDYSSSIDLYRRFVERFPSHPKLEEALYLLGYTLQEDNRGDEAVEVFQRLLRDRPASKFAAEVHFRIGEFQFEVGEYETAVAEYEATLAARDPQLYDKALYKMGWAYYRMGKPHEANRHFIQVIDFASSGKDSESAMRREAIKYIGIGFSDAGGLEALERFITEIGGRPYAIELYLGFADVLYDQTRYAEAIEAYLRTTERFPLHPGNPAILVKVMETHQRMGELESAFAIRERLVREYGPDSVWHRHFAGSATGPARDARLAAQTRELTEKLQYEYAKYWHARAQSLAGSVAGSVTSPADTTPALASKKEKETAKDVRKTPSKPLEPNSVRAARYYDQAADAYALFLRLFPDSKRGAEVGYLLAEILYAKGRWAEAGARYRGVTRDLVNPNNRYFGDAAWNMVLSYRSWLDEYENSSQGRKTLDYYQFLIDRGGEPITDATLKEKLGPPPPFPEPAQKLVEASQYYMGLFPQSERNALLLYSNGQIYLRYGQNAAAREQFSLFLDRYPTHELVFDAIKNVVITYTLERQFGDLNKYAYMVLDGNLGRRQDVSDYLGNILSGSMFKDAQVEEERGHRLRAAAIYQEMVRRFPQSHYADDALFNAAVNLEREGRYYEAISVFERLLKEYPQTPLAPKAVFSIARDNERVLNYLGAVKYYLKLAREFPKESEGPDAVYNSALLLEKLGDFQRAAEVYLEYVARYPNRSDVSQVLFFAGDVYFKASDYARAAVVFENYVRGPYKEKELLVEAYYKWAVCAEKLGQAEKAKALFIHTATVYQEALARGQKPHPSFGAHGAFLKAMDEFEKYKAIKLTLPAAKMAKQLETKAAELKRMEGIFAEVAKIGDPHWTSAALFMLGESYQNFADTLFDAPVPPELNEEEAEVYKLELQDKAFPIEDKALQAYQKQLSTALKLGIENEWTEKTRAKLRKLNPNLERAKANERLVVGRNEFFYRFGSTTDRVADYEIRDGKVVYAGDTVVGKTKDERSELSRAQKKILEAGTTPALLLSGDGLAIEPPTEVRVAN